MIKLTIESNSVPENIVVNRRNSLDQLVRILEGDEYSVHLNEVRPREVNDGYLKHSAPPLFEIAIYVTSGAATAFIGAVVTDVYKKVKKWVLDSNEEGGNHPSATRHVTRETIIIYGPDGKPVLYRQVDSDGSEIEIDLRIAFFGVPRVR